MQKHFAGLSYFAQLTFMVNCNSETCILVASFPVNIDFLSKNWPDQVRSKWSDYLFFPFQTHLEQAYRREREGRKERKKETKLVVRKAMFISLLWLDFNPSLLFRRQSWFPVKNYSEYGIFPHCFRWNHATFAENNASVIQQERAWLQLMTHYKWWEDSGERGL